MAYIVMAYIVMAYIFMVYTGKAAAGHQWQNHDVVFHCNGYPQPFTTLSGRSVPSSQLPSGNQCSASTFAFVFGSNRLHDTYLCPAFWKASGSRSRDSQPGTIIHELAHFKDVMGLKDHAYGTQRLLNLARTNPTKARNNAGMAPDHTKGHNYIGHNYTGVAPDHVCAITI